MTMQPIYLDHAATTPVRPEVLDAMLPFLGAEAFGNPSSGHRFGRTAKAGVEEARRQVAEAVGAEPGEVVFTSGGTEADNLAVIGAALAAEANGIPMVAVVAATEHKAVLASAHTVVRLGGQEVILPVTRDGIVQMDALDAALVHRPAVVSIMWVNNETGVIQPVPEIAARCDAADVVFHSDAVQALGKVPLDLNSDDPAPTLLTLSGHKLGAPKGVGALIVRDRAVVEAIIHGGSQQFGTRPGTENVPGIVGLGKAAELTATEGEVEAHRIGALRDGLRDHLLATIPDAAVVPEGAETAPHVVNMLFPGADSEALLMHLDLAGVAASSGSACSTGSVEPSHVHVAMGIPNDLAISAVRFSLGHDSSSDDITRASAVIPECVAKVRKLSGALGRG